MGILDRGVRVARRQVANPVLARYLEELAKRARVADEPLADMLRRNDRTRALVEGRLDRLTPEQMPGSLGLVARQADLDQSAARAADILAGRNRETALGLGAAGALGAGAFGLQMALEGQQDAQDAMLLEAWENSRNEREESQLAADNQAAAIARAAQAEARKERTLMAGVDRAVSEIDLGGDDEVVFDPMINEPTEADIRTDTMEQFTSQPFLGDERAYRGKNTFFARDMKMGMPSPEDAVAASPGPEVPVGTNSDVEDLPGPQLRSIRALMRGGIPEGRARDIILKGHSMSPDEYRMVTGGRCWR